MNNIKNKELSFFVNSLIIFLFLLAGCSIVEIQGTDDVKTSYGLGVMNVSITPGNGVTMTSTKSLGVAASNSHLNMGWLKEEVIFSSDDCVLVLVLKEGTNSNDIKNNLKELNIDESDICIANTGGGR